ncbi:MAG: hypothetical protein WCC14_11290, partial [Acidobacteriaceae bacterium]
SPAFGQNDSQQNSSASDRYRQEHVCLSSTLLRFAGKLPGFIAGDESGPQLISVKAGLYTI